MSGFQHDIAGGAGNLIITSVQSPGYSASSAGWQIRKDGSAEFNNLAIRGTFNGSNFVLNSNGFFLYSAVPATGNLIISIASQAGTDAHGNSYPQGINVTAGQMSGVNVTATKLTVQQGPVLFYGNTQLITTTFAAGTSGSWVAPAGVTSVQVQAIAGGNSGSISASTGGNGGGGGEFAGSASYTVIPGNSYAYSVGNAAQNTTFDGTGIVAHAGAAASGGGPGAGGTGSTAPVHFDGGAGGSGFGFFGPNGGGGGSSAGPTQPGNAGGTGSGGSAPPGGGAGGGFGSAGSVPGGGGGGNTSGSPKAGAGGQLQLVYASTVATALQCAIAASAGSDTFGNSWGAGLTLVGAAKLEAGLTVSGGAAALNAGASVTGGTATDSLTVGGQLVSIPQSLSGSITSLPADGNSGSTWVSGERAFMNNNWVTPINNNFAAIVAALQAAGIAI